MITYAAHLQPIFNKLAKCSIGAIIVGGYIRNSLLKIDSKDIDIELYGLDSLSELVEILAEYGRIDLVGKSFGVAKLNYKGFELDFSLPRLESKIAKGHKGFSVTLSKNLDFESAAKRRDFTINAIGFNIATKELLDPFNGVEDVEKKLLREVDATTFIEDPLRVFRAIRFSSIYELNITPSLFNLCKKLAKNVNELAYERIFEELSKTLLNSKKPSLALKLLDDLGIVKTKTDFIDAITNIKSEELKKIVAFSVLYHNAKDKEFVLRVIGAKNLKEKILTLNKNIELLSNNMSEYELLKLSTKGELEVLLWFGFCLGRVDKSEFELYFQKAKELDILQKPPKAMLGGGDLIELGLSPSKEFKHMLDCAYDAQLRGIFKSYAKAKEWLKSRYSLVR